MFSRDPDRVNWWSAGVQWVGTLAFNVTTFAALVTGLSAAQEQRLVWQPDFVGSAAFLAVQRARAGRTRASRSRPAAIGGSRG